MSNMESHRRSADMFNSRDWDGFAADLAENCELVDHARNVTVKGRQQHVELEQAWVAAFSDGRITSPRFFDAGSATVMLFTGVGRNDGPFGPFPATGRETSLSLLRGAGVRQRRQGRPDRVVLRPAEHAHAARSHAATGRVTGKPSQTNGTLVR